ncbi:F-box/WD repeat-containing protein 1A [Lachnellula hyalina]|uniref:F-box/WD repeat-containing protein 1A n=1 Tax=Lachnellula hyalina TaxID=1316788 RepID=A0A8H8U3W3_9HELO|nr:F-box/WD repeat-containing protein 1A [Lachnellula hyalina]TVY30702.1 F-box/WD repeat-containing protein 1A [Lachnellula hyalina]
MATYEQSPQDEGYSEDPLTLGTASTPVPPWLASMNISERTEYVMSIIDHLPTSKVCEIVQRLRPRIYIDFFQYLPTEVNLKILGFLDPVSLIHTAQASREWMLLAVDRKLWEHLYILEGFRVIRPEVLHFEAAINSDKSRSSGSGEEEHASKRRATPQRILPNLQADDDFEMVDADMVAPTQSSIFGPLTSEPKDSSVKESSLDPDVQMASPRPMSSPKASKISIPNYPSRPANASHSHRNHRLSTASTLNYPHVPTPASPMSSLVVVDRSDGRKKLNWQYLYSQRRKLEANWEMEKYTNFQLPHPNHPQEAHEECIYTIQHAGKYLVSGSRDRTLRIWNLNTQRLVKPPLRAHTGSVLCLQFDADPEEDLIVSGSSDATVVLWRFSTGQIIQRLRKAHRESVLNVRFDKRVLVTCSKDKTIKIFNRRPMEPGESGYPDPNQGVNPVPIHLNNYGLNPTPLSRLPTLPAYSMLGCLYGHGAAVNAVQIFGDEVVSASGDRTVKVWNWPERTCTRTLIGHSKGIACVQYDGRRIVSGSSDNEVKVFDKESGLEVASLRAHSNLVRTVQAGFGDLPYSSEEDQVEAKQIDYEYFKAIDSGTLSAQQGYQRGRPKNAGSKKPEDITAYGAKLPPGGGGGRFGRIVSGSYDETIIIWRRDKEGVWRAQHTLRQEEAAHMASNAVAREAVEKEALARSAGNPPSEDEPYLSILPKIPNTPNSDAIYRQIIEMTVSQGPTALRTALRDYPPTMTFKHLGDTISALEEGTTKHVMKSVALTAIHEYRQQQAQQATVAGPSEQTSGSDDSIESAAVQGLTEMAQDTSPRSATQAQASSSQQPVTTPMDTTTITSTATATTTTPAPQTQPPTAAAIVPPTAHHHHHHLTNNMARVFKLQFDARRIICCSQTTVIVGWDFANGDESIIEASRFFAPVE